MLHVVDTVSVNDSVKYPAAADDNEGEEEEAATAAADVADAEGEKGWLHDIVGGDDEPRANPRQRSYT